jgi:WD40 repeat protein
MCWWKEPTKSSLPLIPRLLTTTSSISKAKKLYGEFISRPTKLPTKMTAKQLASSGLSLPNDTYIYSLARTTTLCAAISSDDSLRYFDPSNLSLVHTVAKAHQGITCLKTTSDGKGLITAGRDGTVRCWDERAKSAGVQMADRRSFSLSCCCLDTFDESCSDDCYC